MYTSPDQIRLSDCEQFSIICLHYLIDEVPFLKTNYTTIVLSHVIKPDHSVAILVLSVNNAIIPSYTYRLFVEYACCRS